MLLRVERWEGWSEPVFHWIPLIPVYEPPLGTLVSSSWELVDCKELLADCYLFLEYVVLLKVLSGPF